MTRSSEPLPDLRRIMIRSVNWIGDAIMTTPAMAAIRAACPDAEIAVVANPPVAELLAHHPACDRIILFDKKRECKGIAGFLRFCAELRDERFDAAFLFQNAFEAAIMAFAASIPIRVGYRTDGRRMFLSHGLPSSISQGLHHTLYYLRLVERFGMTGGDRRITLACTPEEMDRAGELVPHPRFAVINAGAAYGSAKRWFPERFAAVADAVFDEFGLHPVLIGGLGETEIGAEIVRAARTRVLDLTGTTTVRRMMALIARSTLMITNDSGPMHVGAAFGVPLVALFGPTDPEATAPVSTAARVVRHSVECSPCRRRVCPTDHRCMRSITVDDVLEAARAVLRETKPPSVSSPA